jgi:hypothetical protein
MYHQFNIKIPRSAHTVFLCFMWISEHTAIISLCSINWLVFITLTGSVYCAVGTGSLCIIQGDSFSIRLFRGSPASITLPMVHTHFHRHAALTRKTNGRSLGNFQKPMPFWESVSIGQKSTFAQSSKCSQTMFTRRTSGHCPGTSTAIWVSVIPRNNINVLPLTISQTFSYFFPFLHLPHLSVFIHLIQMSVCPPI